MEVNIEKIMDEIRENIVKNGLDKEEEQGFSKEEYLKNAGIINNSWNIPEHVEPTGKGKVLKRGLGKLLNFAILPRVRKQNEMNVALVRTINQLTAYIGEQDETIRKLNQRIDKLEKELKDSKKE